MFQKQPGSQVSGSSGGVGDQGIEELGGAHACFKFKPCSGIRIKIMVIVILERERTQGCGGLEVQSYGTGGPLVV